MGGSFLSATPATTPMMDAYVPARLDDTIIWRTSWNHERRGPAATWDRYGWRPLWPGSQMMSGDPSSPMGNLGQDGMSGGEYFEPPSNIGSGTQSMNFIKGTCLDSVGNPAADATVQGFRTSDDAFVGQSTTRADGSYDLGTQNAASVQHYLVAYKAGSPDIAGTTVDTLTPTNIDGT